MPHEGPRGEVLAVQLQEILKTSVRWYMRYIKAPWKDFLEFAPVRLACRAHTHRHTDTHTHTEREREREREREKGKKRAHVHAKHSKA